MDSKTSEGMRTTAMKTKAAVILGVPEDIVNEILGLLSTDSDFRSLQSCALVSKSWVPLCRRHLFHTILFTSKDRSRWLETFPVPEESPAYYVREIHLSIGRHDSGPEGFFGYTPWFMNVERVTLLVDERFQPFSIPPFWRLPQSVTSLTISTDAATRLIHIRNIVAQLPKLDDLSLSGSLVAVERRMLLGIGTALKGRFSGKLRLLKGYASPGVVDMLLEIPTGLRFTEVQIRSMHECHLSTVRLVEACSETLVKLSYTVTFHHGCEIFERSFDFSKFPNLQELAIGVGWIGGDLLWIPTALSTLTPATSPRLTIIQLNFTRPSIINRSVGVAVRHIGNNLRRIADEVFRIEQEFGGVVNVTVLRDPGFGTVLDTLNIFQD